MTASAGTHLAMVSSACPVCPDAQTDLIATGYDYEYRTSDDLFRVDRCLDCGTVYLNPRPHESEFARIYPPEYHTLEFSAENYSIVHTIRSRLEARRLLRYCTGIPADARVLDLGCGDGFHLGLLARFGSPGWHLMGVDVDARAVEIARDSGLDVYLGTLDDVDLDPASVDVVYTLQTLEHVADPAGFLRSIYRVLKPGGRLVIVTDNTDSVDFSLFRRRYWGGYHFPRHWHLFNRRSLARLARQAGFRVDGIETIVSPVNWVYSIHNLLVGAKAPRWLVNRFTLKSPVSLSFFTVVDMALQKLGRGALLNGYFTKQAPPLGEADLRSKAASADRSK